MMPDDLYDDNFGSAIHKWEPGIAMFVTHYAVKTPLEFPTQHGTISAVAAGTPGTVERMLRVETDISNNRVALDDPVLLVLCPTVADKTRAPAGYHTLKIVGFQPYEIAKGPDQWDHLKQQVADANLKHLQKFVPTLTPDSIIDQHVKSPLDLERTNSHNWQGACHGGATTLSPFSVSNPTHLLFSTISPDIFSPVRISPPCSTIYCASALGREPDPPLGRTQLLLWRPNTSEYGSIPVPGCRKG